MSSELARVVQLDGDFMLVAKLVSSSCAGCAAEQECGTGILNKYLGKRYRQLRLHNDCGARVGDVVEIVIGEAALLQISILTYVPPLIFIVLGMTLGRYAAYNGYEDFYSIGGAVLGLLLGAWWLRALAASFIRRNHQLVRANLHTAQQLSGELYEGKNR